MPDTTKSDNTVSLVQAKAQIVREIMCLSWSSEEGEP